MKKLLSTLLIAVTLTVTLPKPEAKAGVIIGGGLCAIERNALCALDLLVITPAIAMGGIIVGTVVAVGMSTPLGYWIMGSGIVLDAESTQNGLAQGLSERFPFINDQEVVNELSTALAKNFKYEETRAVSTLDEKTVRNILSATDLSEDEIKMVVSDLN